MEGAYRRNGCLTSLRSFFGGGLVAWRLRRWLFAAFGSCYSMNRARVASSNRVLAVSRSRYRSEAARMSGWEKDRQQKVAANDGWQPQHLFGRGQGLHQRSQQNARRCGLGQEG